MKITTHSRTNKDWLKALKGGKGYDDAVSDLRALLVRGLTFSLSSRIDSDLEANVEDFAQDALLKILDKIDTFRGESKFTTWAQKVAVRVALSEMRRQRWRDVSLESITEREDGSLFTPVAFADDAPLPEQVSSQGSMMGLVSRLFDEALTPRQQEAMTNLMLSGMPMEVVAEKMNTNRNALYKLVHDARLRLKNALEEEGFTPEDILQTFR
jgi:RNA polymerase sigma-70 factor (ECF subfamily)